MFAGTKNGDGNSVKGHICYYYIGRELCYINRNSQQFVPVVVHKIWSCFEISLEVFSEVIVIC